jgi:hypothetical protein
MFKKISLNFIVLCGSLFLIFFIVDKSILLFSGKSIIKMPPFVSNSSESPYGVGLKANYAGRYGNAEYNVAIRINSLGMRDDKEINFEKQEGSYRILCVGDSFTFGQGVESKEAYPKLLENGLRLKFPDKNIEVLNAGWIASNPRAQGRFIREYGIKFKPDMIIVGFFTGNDIVETISEDMTLARKSIFEASYITALSMRTGFIGLLRNLFDRCFPNLYEFLSLKIIKLSYALGYHRNTFDFMLQNSYSKEIENGWHEAFGYLKNINELCKINNIDFILMAIPFPDQVLDVSLDRNLIRNKPQIFLKDFCKNENVNYIDLMPALISHNKEKIYYIKDGHWTKLGHEIAVQEILKNKVVENLFNQE